MYVLRKGLGPLHSYSFRMGLEPSILLDREGSGSLGLGIFLLGKLVIESMWLPGFLANLDDPSWELFFFLSPLIMVQWMAGYLKGIDPIGNTGPIFHFHQQYQQKARGKLNKLGLKHFLLIRAMDISQHVQREYEQPSKPPFARMVQAVIFVKIHEIQSASLCETGVLSKMENYY